MMTHIMWCLQSVKIDSIYFVSMRSFSFEIIQKKKKVSASSAYIMKNILKLYHKIFLKDFNACIWFWKNFCMTNKSWSFNSQDSVVYKNEKNMLLKQTAVYSALSRREEKKREKNSSLTHEQCMNKSCQLFFWNVTKF